MTRRDERVAGIAALVTAALLGTSLLLYGSGPASPHPNGVLAWYGQHGTWVRLGSLAWLAAMLGLVAFAVRLRDALLALTADRWWVGVLFVQGAGVFAAVAVVAAALAWSGAELAASPSADATTVAALWTVHGTLLRFAAWGLTVPLLTAGLALARHSVLGQVAAVAGAFVAVALLVPLAWIAALPAVAAWLALTGVALLRPARRPVRGGDRVPTT